MESGADYEVSRITGIPSSAEAPEEPASPSKGKGKDKDPTKPDRSPALDREELAAMWEGEPLMHSMVTTQPWRHCPRLCRLRAAVAWPAGDPRQLSQLAHPAVPHCSAKRTASASRSF